MTTIKVSRSTTTTARSRGWRSLLIALGAPASSRNRHHDRGQQDLPEKAHLIAT
ncbi:hypothetical protein TIFTF001_031715 [Ficus carica]|uniref:Uncharacterized protein n=1 Tax=Ficus carica TaxID=3494 RepID=A0AA88DVN8_FICCA|nr:hypothetical protein TIFTF001_031715 [Ficus carica]